VTLKELLNVQEKKINKFLLQKAIEKPLNLICTQEPATQIRGGNENKPITSHLHHCGCEHRTTGHIPRSEGRAPLWKQRRGHKLPLLPKQATAHVQCQLAYKKPEARLGPKSGNLGPSLGTWK
jgi:hypothetical protein